MQIDLFTGHGAGRSKLHNNLVCQNFYIEIDKQGNRSLIGTPGLDLFSDTGYEREVRGGIKYGDKSYCVVGEQFFEITSAGVATRIFGVLDSRYGRVTMAKNSSQIGIVDGAEYYLWKESTNTLEKQSRPVLPTPESIVEQDGYFIFNILDSDNFFISGLNDGESISALDYSSAEAKPDFTKTIVSDHKELWHFGEESTEVFNNTGNSDFPFERIGGAFIDRGIRSGFAVSAIDNSLMWLDNFDHVVRANGYVPLIVSTPAISYQISKLTIKTDAISYSYNQEGHWFFVLTFPTDGKTFVYDALTDSWATRTSGANNLRHRGNCAWLFGSDWLIGDYENGKIFKYNLDKYTDDGDVIVSKVSTRVKSSGRKLMKHSNFELEIETGIGLASGQGSDPQVIMSFSDDAGKKWSNERWRGIGKIGETKTRVRWERLGASRDRIYDISITDPVKRHITGAFLNE